MANPIHFSPKVDPQTELQRRLKAAPEEHAEALLVLSTSSKKPTTRASSICSTARSAAKTPSPASSPTTPSSP